MSRERHKESKEKRGEKTGVTEEESVNVRDKEVRLAPETLRQLATHQRPAYGPDFLRTFAKGRSDGTLFDVITGRDAHRFCRRFVREQAGKDGNAKGSEGKGKEREREREKEKEREKSEKTLPPVVFALSRSTAGDAGRKVVDYYMTWRGKTKTTRLKGLARRAGFLDAEFRRVRETLDGEWKRASRVLRPSSHYEPDTEANGKGVPQLVRAPTDPQALPRLAPFLASASAHKEKEAEQQAYDDEDGPLLPPRPVLGTHRASLDSVASLPLLGMVRGVPVGNRVPLRVMNPGDRMSMSSSSGSVNEVQAAAARSKPTRGSPLRDGVAFDVGEVAEDDANASAGGKAHKVQLPGRTASDSSGTSTSASSSGSSTRKHRREKKSSSAAEEGEKEKILIVLLDEKDKDRDNKGSRKGDDDTTWHGLERRLSTRSTQRKPSSTSSAHHSPWMGPLVHLDEDVKYIHVPEHSDSSDSEDDDDDDGSDWDGQRGGGAVVPIKSMLTAMGYLTPEAAVMGGSGGASPYSPYAGTLPMQTPYNSPYAAAAAQLAAYSSPYVAPLSLPYPSQQGSPYAQPLPPSRPQTPMSYFAGGTPQQQWGSPAPAGYTSPSASYANLAAAYANSAAGYMSPNAGYASPAAYASPGAGYANLAAGYSSPYVPLQQGTGTGGSHYYG